MVQPVLTEPGDLRRGPRDANLVLVQPLLHQNSDRSGRETAYERREPEDVESDSPRFCLHYLWFRDDGGHRMGRVDERRIDGETVELERYLPQNSKGRVRRRGWLEKEIGLDVECGLDSRE